MIQSAPVNRADQILRDQGINRGHCGEVENSDLSAGWR
jgi:hypothetical protein